MSRICLCCYSGSVLLTEWCSTTAVDILGHVRQHQHTNQYLKTCWLKSNSLKCGEATVYDCQVPQLGSASTSRFEASTSTSLGRKAAVCQVLVVHLHVCAFERTIQRSKIPECKRAQINNMIASGNPASCIVYIFWTTLKNMFQLWIVSEAVHARRLAQMVYPKHLGTGTTKRHLSKTTLSCNTIPVTAFFDRSSWDISWKVGRSSG